MNLTEAQRKEMVDRRVCRILLALDRPATDANEETIVTHYMADEWACLEIAAAIVAPAYDLDPHDEAVLLRLKRAAHAALKLESQRIAGEAGKEHR